MHRSAFLYVCHAAFKMASFCPGFCLGLTLKRRPGDGGRRHPLHRFLKPPPSVYKVGATLRLRAMSVTILLAAHTGASCPEPRDGGLCSAPAEHLQRSLRPAAATLAGPSRPFRRRLPLTSADPITVLLWPFGRHRGQTHCSICLAKKPAAVSASFVSKSPMVTSGSRLQRITAPMGSPAAMMGATT